MMTSSAYDIAIIGSGPGGYVAAIRAAQLGLKTVVIERAELGGICLNWGCIPTKALLRSSELLDAIERAADFGLVAENVSFDLTKIVERSRAVAGQLSNGVQFLLKKNKVDVVMGDARLEGAGVLQVSDAECDTQINATHIILATGARARTLPGLEPDGELIWTYKEALTPDVTPGRLLVIGSGAIGIEFASFFRTLGSEVTVVEVLDRVLPVEDEEISALAAKAFEKQGMSIRTQTTVEELIRSDTEVAARLKTPDGNTEMAVFDRVIVAIGITGNVENLGLEEAGVTVDRGHVVINERFETSAAGIFAIGDLVGPPWLAHKASHEGVLCVERLAGHAGIAPLDTTLVPGCTYCRPQIASLGLTEAAAIEAGREIRVGRFPFLGNGKAIALGEPEGLVKTIFDAGTGELIGAHMIGAEVTELIQGFAIAKAGELTEAELMSTIFPHPTLSEMMHESVLDAFDQVIHV
jgi:dihydrolipoamide dehydrogenase